MKTYILINLLLFSLYSCKNDVKKETVPENKSIIINESYWNDSISKQIYRASSSGDTLAYKELYYDCWRKGRTDEILLISMIMANKYKYNYAYFNVYISLSRQHKNDTEGVNNTNNYLALYYLLKAKEKGYSEAIYGAEEIFKNKKIPSSKYYLLKLAEE